MCGVVGVMGAPQAAQEVFLGLTTLQHRGQDGAGILTYDADGFHRVKNLGLVESVFTRDNIRSLTGTLAIGHARYSTTGRGDITEVQPLMLGYPFGIGMVHNGNVINVDELRAELRTQARRHLLTRSDTEVLMNLFAEGLAQQAQEAKSPEEQFEQICTAVQGLFERVQGSYSVAAVVADHGLVAFRDPYGIRPLVWGERVLPDGSKAQMVASESVALSFLGYQKVRDLEPAEVWFVDLRGKVHYRVLKQQQARPCMFEWVYFASPESEIDEVAVYGARIRLGEALAEQVRQQMEQGRIQPEIIVPVPETSRIAAIALSEALRIPYREVLIKNRYIKRTFILDSHEKRQSAVSLKLSPVRSEIAGKNVLLVDDSIVRGTTSRKIIELVRAAGARQVYFVSTCPPIRYPCFYGIDFPDPHELIASQRSLEQIEQELGADAVIYQDLAGLLRSVRGSRMAHPCVACLTGEYPVGAAHAQQHFAEARRKERLRGFAGEKA